ncbi:hypothetical protein PoB_001958100 [Plakobranchus ocellatus]|uniref:Uncharacterized protein n=1 Tax=Plakobranchus ocellatus TaxID=259542 RepID=A0AAV3ZAX2_9GAST|nr:hypothetical protein PoB_001958100 [Plakobranchus ocellatus]
MSCRQLPSQTQGNNCILILVQGEVIGDGTQEHQPLISLVGDIGNGGLGHWPSITLMGDIDDWGTGLGYPWWGILATADLGTGL